MSYYVTIAEYSQHHGIPDSVVREHIDHLDPTTANGRIYVDRDKHIPTSTEAAQWFTMGRKKGTSYIKVDRVATALGVPFTKLFEELKKKPKRPLVKEGTTWWISTDTLLHMLRTVTNEKASVESDLVLKTEHAARLQKATQNARAWVAELNTSLSSVSFSGKDIADYLDKLLSV